MVLNEMRMLIWMCGVTRRDKIRNEHIRGTTRVVQASKKITDRKRHAKSRAIVPGNAVLIRQPKRDKLTTPFNHRPYTDIKKQGNDDQNAINEVSKGDCIIMGDFNHGNIKWDTLQSTGVEDSTFLCLVQDNFLTQHVLEPTRAARVLDI